jgi:hypothetical protein
LLPWATIHVKWPIDAVKDGQHIASKRRRVTPYNERSMNKRYMDLMVKLMQHTDEEDRR